VFGDQLSFNPTTATWVMSYSSVYSSQCGTVTNYAENGGTLFSAVGKFYTATTTITADAIIWLGANDFLTTSMSNLGIFRSLITCYASLAAYTIFKPPVLTLASGGYSLTGSWNDNDQGAAYGRGIYIQGTGTFILTVTTRYVWVHMVLDSGTASTQNYLTWTIDGSSTESTTVQVPDMSNSYQYPYDLFIDRGAANIGVSTTFTLNSMVGQISPKTRIIAFKMVDTIPTSRATIVGLWQPLFTSQHNLGGPSMVSAVDITTRQVVNSYRLKGFDMRYVLPPLPLSSDLIGEGTNGVNTYKPNTRFTPLIAQTIASVALAPVSTSLILY
jgi:hypothetical protein